MSRNNSGSVIRGGARGESMSPTQPSFFPVRYPVDESTGAERSLEALLRLAVQKMGRELTDVLPRDVRGDADSYFLKDCIAGKRAPSDATLGRLLRIQARAEAHERHIVSNALREVEGRLAPAAPICVFEASEAEQRADADMDMAQLQLARERSKTRLEQFIASGQKHYQALRVALDAAYHQLARMA